MQFPSDFDAFRALSARLGGDPLRVQGPGGNTSFKSDGIMWIKASGTELADAVARNIFVPVDRAAARSEATGETGDGSCKETVLDPENSLRPSIETTFHAALDWPVVAHTHSVATLVHAVSTAGRAAALEKLADLPVAMVPYAKPGLPLTAQILAHGTAETQVYILENHGLIVCGNSVDDVAHLMDEVENCLALPVLMTPKGMPDHTPPDGFEWAAESWIAQSPPHCERALAGSYYPDHVVFLGPALPRADEPDARARPAFLIEGEGIARRIGATSSQKAMLTCLGDMLARLPDDWAPIPIGAEAEASLLNWDAEKYRQALAAKSQ